MSNHSRRSESFAERGKPKSSQRFLQAILSLQVRSIAVCFAQRAPFLLSASPITRNRVLCRLSFPQVPSATQQSFGALVQLHVRPGTKPLRRRLGSFSSCSLWGILVLSIALVWCFSRTLLSIRGHAMTFAQKLSEDHYYDQMALLVHLKLLLSQQVFLLPPLHGSNATVRRVVL